eukprot:1343211-Pyramimonas_sp.AAC.2
MLKWVNRVIICILELLEYSIVAAYEDTTVLAEDERLLSAQATARVRHRVVPRDVRQALYRGVNTSIGNGVKRDGSSKQRDFKGQASAEVVHD